MLVARVDERTVCHVVGTVATVMLQFGSPVSLSRREFRCDHLLQNSRACREQSFRANLRLMQQVQSYRSYSTRCFLQTKRIEYFSRYQIVESALPVYFPTNDLLAFISTGLKLLTSVGSSNGSPATVSLHKLAQRVKIQMMAGLTLPAFTNIRT